LFSREFVIFRALGKLCPGYYPTPETTVPAFAGTQSVFVPLSIRGRDIAAASTGCSYFFFAAFFLAFFFALAMMNLQLWLVRGRSIRTRIEITSKKE